MILLVAGSGAGTVMTVFLMAILVLGFVILGVIWWAFFRGHEDGPGSE